MRAARHARGARADPARRARRGAVPEGDERGRDRRDRSARSRRGAREGRSHRPRHRRGVRGVPRRVLDSSANACTTCAATTTRCSRDTIAATGPFTIELAGRDARGARHGAARHRARPHPERPARVARRARGARRPRRCSCSATIIRGTRARPSATTTTSASTPTTAKRCARVIDASRSDRRLLRRSHAPQPRAPLRRRRATSRSSRSRA